MTKQTSDHGIRIRVAIEGDQESICELLFALKRQYGSCVESTKSEFCANYLATVRDSLSNPDNVILVAANNLGRIVAFASFTTRLALRVGGLIASLEEIYVVPEYRRQRIATSLWLNASNRLRSAGIRTIEVVTSLAHPGQRQFAKGIGLEWYSNIHRATLK
jgi:GNAT superfamily N-acetyltransferase